MSIQNLNTFDPFADAIKGSDDDVQDGLVHIRIQQRNGRKTLTTVQGLSSEYDLKKIVRACKKEFACNGTVIEHPEYGEVLQLQGDQRENICQWLTKAGLAKPEQLKVCGAAVGLTGDICRALKNKVLPYCDEIMMLLLENLGDNTVHRSVKPQILSMFGDIALSIGPEFKKYLEVVLQTLVQASQAQVDRIRLIISNPG